jgi:hypothetical protein
MSWIGYKTENGNLKKRTVCVCCADDILPTTGGGYIDIVRAFDTKSGRAYTAHAECVEAETSAEDAAQYILDSQLMTDFFNYATDDGRDGKAFMRLIRYGATQEQLTEYLLEDIGDYFAWKAERHEQKK